MLDRFRDLLMDRPVDALSQALAVVRFHGATFFRLRCGAPWGFSVPPADVLRHAMPGGTDLLLHYHLVTSGRATVRVGDASPIAVEAGDVIVFPRGDGHTVWNGEPQTIVESRPPLEELMSGRPSLVEMGASGAPTEIVCGFFACSRPAEHLFLQGLPSAFTVSLRSGASGAWLERSIDHLVAEAEAGRPGAAALLSKTADALFVETLRQYASSLPDEAAGWLSAARDPVVGRALARLHHEPAHKWTNELLAEAVHTSTSVLVDRFNALLGVAPSAYLTRWRLSTAAMELETTTKSVLEVAMEVGYTSEAAFNRAFKRQFGLPPRRFTVRHDTK